MLFNFLRVNGWGNGKAFKVRAVPLATPIMFSLNTNIFILRQNIEFLPKYLILFINYDCKWYSIKNIDSLISFANLSDFSDDLGIHNLSSIILGAPIILIPTGGSIVAMISSGTQSLLHSKHLCFYF